MSCLRFGWGSRRPGSGVDDLIVGVSSVAGGELTDASGVVFSVEKAVLLEGSVLWQLLKEWMS